VAAASLRNDGRLLSAASCHLWATRARSASGLSRVSRTESPGHRAVPLCLGRPLSHVSRRALWAPGPFWSITQTDLAFSPVQTCLRVASLSMASRSTSSMELSACLLKNSHSGRTVALSSVPDKKCVCMPREDALTLCFQYALAFFCTKLHLPVFLSGCCNLSVCGRHPAKLQPSLSQETGQWYGTSGLGAQPYGGAMADLVQSQAGREVSFELGS